MTTTEQRNDASIRTRRAKLERLAASYAAALYEAVSILHRRGRMTQPHGRRPNESADHQLAGMTA